MILCLHGGQLFGARGGGCQRGLLAFEFGGGLLGFAGQSRLVGGQFLHRAAGGLNFLPRLFGCVDLFSLFCCEFFDRDFGLFEFAGQLGAGAT